MSSPPPCPVRKIADARKQSSSSMAITITDRRFKGAPIPRLRRTSNRLRHLAATAFRVGRMCIPSLFLALCTIAPTTAAEAANRPADPVREAAARAIKTLDLQVSMPHTPTKLDDFSGWHLHMPAWLIYVAGTIGAIVIGYIVLDMVPGWRAREDDDWGRTGTGSLGSADPR